MFRYLDRDDDYRVLHTWSKYVQSVWGTRLVYPLFDLLCFCINYDEWKLMLIENQLNYILTEKAPVRRLR